MQKLSPACVMLRLQEVRPKPVYIKTRSFKSEDELPFRETCLFPPWFVFDIFDNGEGKENTFHLLFERIIEISGSPIGSLYQAPAYTRYTTLHINIITFSKHFLISPTAC